MSEAKEKHIKTHGIEFIKKHEQQQQLELVIETLCWRPDNEFEFIFFFFGKKFLTKKILSLSQPGPTQINSHKMCFWALVVAMAMTLAVQISIVGWC